jgi:hypothetical protein
MVYRAAHCREVRASADPQNCASSKENFDGKHKEPMDS